MAFRLAVPGLPDDTRGSRKVAATASTMYTGIASQPLGSILLDQRTSLSVLAHLKPSSRTSLVLPRRLDLSQGSSPHKSADGCVIQGHVLD